MSKRCCGINALQMAAICGHEKLFALLLAEIPPEKKFEAICFNDKLQYGETMQKVITRGYTEVAELVLNELETVSTTEQMNTFLFLKYDNGDTSLHVAAEKGYLQIARKLLELAEDPFELMMSTGRYNDSALLRSVNFDQIKMAEVLIQTISKEKIYSTFCVLAADGSNIFHASVSSKNFDFIKLIGEKVKDAGMHPEEMREFLLKKNRQGNNVLHIAAEKSNLEVTTYLLEYMSNVIEQTQYDLIVVQGADKHTVIHRAVFSGQTEVVEYLIDIVPDQKIRFVYDLLDEGTRNIFHLAAMRDNSRFVKLILEKLDKEFSGEERREFFYLKTGQGNNAFHLASEKGNVAVMKYLLKYAKTISAESEYSLIMAKDGTGSSVLQRAVLFARSDIAQFLMRFVPKDKMKSIFQDLDNFENSILHASVTTWQEDCDLLNWLLRILSNELSIEQIRKCFHLKNKDGNTALHLAAEYNSSTVMKCLLKYAASIYENQSIYDFIMLEGEDDCSVIEKAVSLGSVETVECLLGMIPNEKKYTVYLNADANGYNIFHRAIHRMDEAVIYLFTRKLETEFSVEQKREIFFSKTIEGNNVLHLAALKIDNTIMNNLFGFAVRISGRSGYELLLEKNLEGNTVLHCTALNSSSAMIENMFRKIPIEKIYSTFLIKNNKGYNILHFAALQEDSSILKVLLQKLDSSLSSEEMRELLLLPSDAKHNVLHIAAGGKKDKSNCLMECATKISSLAPIDFITVKDVYGHSALCRAVRFGSLEVSEFLLNKIPKEKICSVLTEVDQIGMNLLHHAACRQDCDFVHLILNKIKVTITEEQLKKFFYLKTNEGFTALAVMHSLAVTEYLFKFGTDILKEDAFTLITTPGPSDTPLIHTAVGLGLVEHVSFFLDNVTEKQMYNSFCSTNSDGRSLLHFTVLQENLPFIQMILEKLESVLPTAEERLNYFFLRANDGDSVLSLAAGNTSLEAMKFLLDYAANISKRHVCDLVIPNDAGNNSMIHEAMVSGKFEVAEYLINMTSKEKVYSIFLLKDLAGRNVLHCAAHRKNLKFIQLVTKKLEESVPMEVIKTAFLLTTNSGDNVLHIAAIQDDSSVAKYLLNYALTVLNLDVYHLLTVTGSENMSVIHKAAAFGNTDLAKDIVETIPKQKLHSILSLTDDNGYNILHHSALKGDCALLELIIIKLQATWPVEQIKDYIFSKAKNGKNPLHIAAGKNHASVLKSLLEFACIIFVEDPENLILKIMGLPLDKIHQDVLYPIICQAIDKNGCNMLHTAILKKDITLITWILEHALPNERLREYLFQETKKRFTAFQMAATKSSKTVLKYLLHYAANKLDEDLYDLIISKTAGYDECAIIQLAVAFASIEVVEYLLDIIPQEKMYSTFRFVTNNNEVSILQYGAAVSKKWDILDLVLKKLKSSSLSTEEIKQLFLMKCKDGFNIFHAAVENLDDPSIIENLNKYATETLNLNTCDLILEKSIEGYTSIKTAVCRGRIEVLDYVLSIIPHEKLFEAFSSSDKNGENILHEAAVRQDPDFIQLIIKKIEEAMSLKEKQELLSLTSNLKNTAFHRAAAKNVLQVVVFLFEYGARILGKDQFSFITAKNINDYTAIHGALYSGCFEVAEYLINIIPPDKIYSTFRMVEKSGSNFLHLAAFRDDCNFVKLIVDKLEGLGMPNKLVQDFFFLKTKTGENVLHLAAEKSNFTVFKYLLDYAEKISLLSQYELINAKNSKNSSVIFKAVALGHADVAEFVLDTIPEGKLYSCIRESDKLGGNILHFSASNKNSTVIQFLMKKLETKLTPQQVEELFFSGMLKGGCVLHVAAENENSDILKYLLEYAVKISGSTYYDQIILKDVKGNTVLHHASFKGKPDPGRFLLDLIPKEKLYTIVCAPNMDGCNVLLLSVVQNNCALIKLIMEKLKSIVTANQIIKLMRSKARTGQTAFELASEKGYSDIITYLSEIEENL